MTSRGWTGNGSIGLATRRAGKLAMNSIVAATAALVLAGCGRGAGAAQEGHGQMPPPEVAVAQVLSKQVQLWDDYNGRVTAPDAVELRPRVSGYVERVAYKEGQEVKQGDLMFLIDPRPYRAALNSAQAQLERARATERLTELQVNRAQTLIASKAISQQELDSRSASHAQATADVHAAEAAVVTARLNLEFTEVRAPVDGRASRAMVTVGNLAQADETLLTSLVSQDPVYVYFDADEHSYLRYKEQERKDRRVAADRAVRIGLANEQGYPHVAAINFLDNQVNPTTGTIRARAVLRNQDRRFTPGLYARVQFAGSATANALLIDDKAVLTDQDRKYVYVLDQDNKAQRKDIVIGRMVDNLRVVQSGLSATDKVVVAGVQKIFFPGTPVTPSEVKLVQSDQVPPAQPDTPAAPVENSSHPDRAGQSQPVASQPAQAQGALEAQATLAAIRKHQ